jgi:hypothetical protein
MMVSDVKCSGELVGNVVGELSEIRRNRFLAFYLESVRLVSRTVDVRYIKITSVASLSPILAGDRQLEEKTYVASPELSILSSLFIVLLLIVTVSSLLEVLG